MLLLASNSDLLRVITGAAVTTDVHASWVDMSGSTITPGRTNTPITTATTTTVVASPAASTYRTVKSLHIRNRHASTAQDVTVIHTDGANAMELIKVQLPAGFVLHYDEGAGFEVLDNLGRTRSLNDSTWSAATNALNLVTLGADVTNNNATANTMRDVTGLSFSVTANEEYEFEFLIPYTAAATTTGSRWSINGPAFTMLSYASWYTLTTTTRTENNFLQAYDSPASSNATSAATGHNLAYIKGIVHPSSSGTVIARFASEVSSSAIVAKAGASLKWVRTN